MSKKQSLLMPLQGLRRRIPACSPGDPPGSEIWGHPRGDRATPVLPWEGLGASLGLLCWPQGWEGEQRTSGKPGREECPSCQAHSSEQIFISTSPCTEELLWGGWDGNGAAGGGSARIAPSSAPSSTSSMLDSFPNVKLQKMLICLSVQSHSFHHHCGNNSNLIIASAGSENTHSSQQLSTSISVGHSCSAGSPPRLPGTTEDSHLS